MTPRTRKLLIWVLATVAGVVVLGSVVAVGVGAYAFSLGTAMVTVKVDATVYDRRTHAPVPNCLLAFEQHESSGWGQTSVRTDAQGRSSHETTYSYVGSLFWPFARERDPRLRFYLGEAPRYGTFDEVETWDLWLRFREPWTSRADVHPAVSAQRSMSHEEVLQPPLGKHWRAAGSEPIPAGLAADQAKATLRLEPSQGTRVYRVSLTLLLDPKQIDHVKPPSV